MRRADAKVILSEAKQLIAANDWKRVPTSDLSLAINTIAGSSGELRGWGTSVSLLYGKRIWFVFMDLKHDLQDGNIIKVDSENSEALKYANENPEKMLNLEYSAIFIIPNIGNGNWSSIDFSKTFPEELLVTAHREYGYTRYISQEAFVENARHIHKKLATIILNMLGSINIRRWGVGIDIEDIDTNELNEIKPEVKKLFDRGIRNGFVYDDGEFYWAGTGITDGSRESYMDKIQKYCNKHRIAFLNTIWIGKNASSFTRLSRLTKVILRDFLEDYGAEDKTRAVLDLFPKS
jgi:hypothetical protein